MHIVWQKKYLKYKNKYLELKTKYNNLIGGGKILINIYINKQYIEKEMRLGTSTNIKELLSNIYKPQVRDIIEFPQTYEYEYEINSIKKTIEAIKTDFISKIKSDYQTYPTDLIINIYIKKLPITRFRDAKHINKNNMDLFMQHLNEMDDDTLFVFIDGCAFMQEDANAIEKNIKQQMPIDMLKYAFDHKLKIKFILLDMEFHKPETIMYNNLAAILNMDINGRIQSDDASIIHVFKFNINKLAVPNERNEKYISYIQENISFEILKTLDIELYYVPIEIKLSGEMYTVESTLKYDIIDFTFIKNKRIFLADHTWRTVVVELYLNVKRNV